MKTLQANRDAVLKHRTGLTRAEYHRILASQGGACASCKDHRPGKGNEHFSVDHDHKTGRIRGLLCRDCNFIIGHARDNRDTLEKCKVYLFGDMLNYIMGTPPPGRIKLPT